MKKIVFTGGGTAGHVTPNLALIKRLQGEFEICYIGSYNGIEKELIEKAGIPYYGISSGKLRRYHDLKNLSDPFRVIKGCHEARVLMKQLKPDVVFSKGGFVSVPVVLAAKRTKVPVICHESDMTPGLANKLSTPAATKVCVNFPETLEFLPEGKAVFTGTPIREELFAGDREKGLAFCGFTADKPVLMMIGGSTGAAIINETLRAALPELTKDFQIIHLCGKGKADESVNGTPGYVQYEYINEELPDLFAATDIVLSRAGANAICELLALKKPNVLIPLSAAVSRGDQILNADSFKKQGYSYVLQEEDMTKESLAEAIHTVYENRAEYIKAMENSAASTATDLICDMIREIAK